MAIFTAVKVAERALRAERHFGDVRVRMYAPGVSPLLAVTADSVTVRGPGFNLHLIRPSARLIDWFSLSPSRSTLYFRVDSAALRLHESADSEHVPIPFPARLRFPVSAGVEWRILTVQTAQGARFDVGAAQLRSRGRLGVGGEFVLMPFVGAADTVKAARHARVKVQARWRGPVVHYDLEVVGEAGDRVFVSGIRDKRDLRRGTDSLDIAVKHPTDWFPSGISAAVKEKISLVSELKIRGRADWRARNLQVTGSARTAEHSPLQSCIWTFNAKATPRGGSLALEGRGEGQSFRARGKWSHPESWPGPTSARVCRAQFSGEARGGEWAIGHHKLPMEFEVTTARLDTGLHLSAHVVTKDKSEIDLLWNGDRPGRLEFSGPVSSHEAWATVWTDTNVSFLDASLKGEWENGRVTGVTHLRGVRAYGASADSIEAGHEVTSSTYTLQSARIYKNGEAFTGTGYVRWQAPTKPRGHHAVSLRFEARHPEYGLVVFEMPHEHLLMATADNLRVAQFPYEPMARFVAFSPWVDGTFRWDLAQGDGAADLSASYSSAGNLLQARLQADWDRDSLRAHTAEMTTGPSRVAGRGVLPLHGRSLRGLYGLGTVMGGTWRVGADSLRISDVYALVGRSPRLMDGYVKGELDYSPERGLAGEMKTGPLKIPALHEWAELTGSRYAVWATLCA